MPLEFNRNNDNDAGVHGYHDYNNNAKHVDHNNNDWGIQNLWTHFELLGFSLNMS